MLDHLEGEAGTPMPDTHDRWESSQGWALLVRVIGFLFPVAVSFLAARVVAARMRAPDAATEVVLWWFAVIVASAIAFRIAERGARRLLPLEALLRLSLAFPDKAPSRFKIARAAGNPREVRAAMASLLRRDAHADPARAAEVILSLVSALSMHDRRTRGHSERTRVYTDLLAEELKLPRAARDRLRWAALLHDIGKLEVATEILNKDGKPDDDEWSALQRHPEHGARLVAPLAEWLGEWTLAVVHHHERFDGAGYPHGLAGEGISLAGRIVAVADAFETMTAARPYKRPMTVEAARQELVDCASTHFDPDVVRAFLNVSLGRSRWLSSLVSAVTQTPFASSVSRFTEQLGLLGRALTSGAAVVAGAAIITAASPSPTPSPSPPFASAPAAANDIVAANDVVAAAETPHAIEPSTPEALPSPAPAPAPVPARPPVALDDVATTAEDTAVSVTVLANDSDPDGNLLPSTLRVSAPGSGTASVADDAVRFAPAADRSGMVEVVYEVCDATGLCASATLTIAVTPVDDAPRPAPDARTLTEDSSASVAVLANDTDPEDDIDPTTLRIVAAPSNGTAAVDAATNRITYTPGADFNGSDTIRYRICDATALCASSSVALTVLPVNDPYTAVDDTAITAEDTAVTISVLANDLDVDGNIDPASLSVSDESQDGTVTVLSGALRYKARANFFGADSFTYTACDLGGSCDGARVDVTIASVPDAPVAVPDSASTVSGATVTIDVAGDDFDVDGNLDPTTVSIATPPASGVATAKGDGTIDYTPPGSFSGPDALWYRICDTTGLCATAKVTISVGANRAPVATDDWTATDEQRTIRIVVLANDYDRDGNLDPSTVQVTTQPISGKATASANPDGTVTYVAPTNGHHEDDRFTYEVCDTGGLCDGASVTIAVSHPSSGNHAPAAAPDVAVTDEDTAVTVDVLANDLDPESNIDRSSVTVTAAPARGGTSVDPVTGRVTYTPDPDTNGVDAFTYQVCDGAGACGSATVTVIVDPVNDAFIPAPDAASTQEDTAVSIDVLANDVDVDGGVDPTSVSISVAATRGSTAVNAINGRVAYTPDPDISGADSFTYRACALDGDCGTAEVTITISAANDAPNAVSDTLTVAEDTPGTVDVLANDTDVEGDPLTVSGFDAVSAAGGTVSCTSSGTCTYTPMANVWGTDSFGYTVSDGAATATGTVSVTVTPVNDPPVPQKDFAKTDVDLAVNLNVLGNDTDPDGDPLNLASYTTTSSGGTVSCTPQGDCTYQPASGFSGIDQFTYTIADGNGGSANSKAKITVRLSGSPNANNDTASVAAGASITITVLANDLPGANAIDPASVTIVEAPGQGSASANPDGTISYPAPSGWTGLVTIQYQVCDTTGKCDTAVISITVT